jgi:hypothetical protein
MTTTRTAAPAVPAADRDPTLYAAEDFLPFTRTPAGPAPETMGSLGAMVTPAYGTPDASSEAARLRNAGGPQTGAEAYLPFATRTVCAVGGMLTEAYGAPGRSSEISRSSGFYTAEGFLPFVAVPTNGTRRRAA